MRNADVLEACNREQLATTTDRLLLCGRLSKHRPLRSATPARGAALHRARGLQVHRVAIAPEPATDERTVVVRSSSVIPQIFAVTVVLPTLVGLAIGLVALL